MNENKLNDIIQTSLENVRSMVDANTVIGTPINTPNGTTVIPISKIAVGFASGGLDYSGKATAEKSNKNFGGGNGTGVTVSPVGFLVISPTGAVELLNVSKPSQNDTIDQISSFIERSPEIVEKFKAVFSKKKEEAKEETVAEKATATETDAAK